MTVVSFNVLIISRVVHCLCDVIYYDNLSNIQTYLILRG